MLQRYVFFDQVVTHRPSFRVDRPIYPRLLPFWCDVRETAWTMRMRSQVAAIAAADTVRNIFKDWKMATGRSSSSRCSRSR